ncbi:hypothetical protein KSX_94640 [Ktedonospora formicarum]|uniref:Uncharacterized protein n=1 Tax=Ktedonospora formicarum TaxID=2778364 RepID=A0A8J3IC57_9CHLR|nr:hypothetical protein KSX_94640 [Ktedonospora formicarum]
MQYVLFAERPGAMSICPEPFQRRLLWLSVAALIYNGKPFLQKTNDEDGSVGMMLSLFDALEQSQGTA